MSNRYMNYKWPIFNSDASLPKGDRFGHVHCDSWPGKTCTKTSVERSVVRSSKARDVASVSHALRWSQGDFRIGWVEWCTSSKWRFFFFNARNPCGFLMFKSASYFWFSSPHWEVALKIRGTNSRVPSGHLWRPNPNHAAGFPHVFCDSAESIRKFQEGKNP